MEKPANTKTIHQPDFVPALRFAWATKLYDVAIQITMREKLLRQRTVEHVQKTKPNEVLEAGCGTGSLTLALAQSLPGANITGVDVDPYILKLAEKKLQSVGNVRFIPGNLILLDSEEAFSSRRFDHIVSSLVLHHLTSEQKVKALRNLYLLMKPGAKITIADWGPPVGIVPYLGFWLVRLLDGMEVTRANRKGMVPSILSEAGFVIEDVIPLHQTALGTVWLYQASRNCETSRDTESAAR